jgi:hypothetical protein
MREKVMGTSDHLKGVGVVGSMRKLRAELASALAWWGTTKEDVDRLIKILEVAIAFVDTLALLIMWVAWLWSILECPSKLVAMFGSVDILYVPRTLLFKQFIVGC